MASFSYQHLPILDDSDFMASNKSNMSGLLVDQYHHQIDHDQGSNNSNICFPAQFYYPISSDHHHHHHHTTVHGIPVDHIVSSGIIMNKSENTTSCDIVDDQQQNNTSIMTTKTYCTLSSDDNEPLSSVVTKKHSTTDSSTLVDKLGESSGEQVTQKLMAKNSTERKRKITRNGSSSINSAQSKDAREKGRGKKQKNGTGSEKEEVKKVKVNNGKNDETNNKKGQEEPPTGYIHVRARRGQATDSHSLAERARREKISERMKMLQRLVPGCEKVTGKAIMMDEIINYVQSLQNQVEFLSMKLASLNPMFYDFGMDIDAFVVRPEGLNAMASQIQSMPQCSQAQPTAFTTDNNNHQILMDTSASLVLQQGQRPNAFSHVCVEDNVSLLWDMEDQRQSFNLNPSGFSNLWSFN